MFGFKPFLLASVLAALPVAAQSLSVNPDKALSVTNFSSQVPRVDLNRTRTGDFYRHALFFDLSEISGTVTRAALRIREGLGTQVSTGHSRLYRVWDVTTPLDEVTRSILAPSVADFYSDLGEGTLFGSTTVAVTPTNGANPLPSPGLTVDLSGGLSAINDALGSRIGLGGQLSGSFYMFSGAADLSKIELDLTLKADDPIGVVPLPATLPLLMLSFGGLAMADRLHRRATN